MRSAVSPRLRLALVTAIAALVGFWGARALTLSRTSSEVRSTESGEASAGPGSGLSAESRAVGAPNVATPPPAIAQLAEAAEEKDLLRAAAKMFDGIDRLTAVDFAWYTATRSLPLDSPDPYSGAGDAMAQSAVFADAFVARWLDVAPDRAVAVMIAMSRPVKDHGSPRGTYALRNALARARPAEFLAAGRDLPSYETNSGDPNWPSHIAFIALGKTQPEAARRLAAELPPDRQAAARLNIAIGLAEVDPVTAIGLNEVDNFHAIASTALQSAERIGLGVLRQVLQAGGKKLAEQADLSGLVARHPELAEYVPFDLGNFNQFSGDFRGEIAPLSMSEIQKRLANEEQIPKEMRPAMVGQLAEAWAVQEPVAAVDWTLARHGKTPDADAVKAAQMAFAVWRERDWSAAMARWNALPESDLKTAVGNDAAIALRQRGDVAGALQLFRPLPIHEVSDDDTRNQRQFAFDYITYAAARSDPPTAAEWVIALPERVETTEVLQRALGEWTRREAGEAEAWVEGLADGGQRDRAAAAMAAVLAPRESDLAGEWVDAMTDAAARAKTTRALYFQLSKANPLAARAWLRGRAGLVPEEIERAIRLGR